MDVSTIEQDLTYISTDQFFEMADMHEEYIPYHREFSFDKYISSLREKAGIGCTMSKNHFVPLLEEAEAKIKKDGIDQVELLDSAISKLILPSMFFDTEKTFVSKPFTKRFVKTTKGLEDFFNSGEWQMEVHEDFISQDRNIIAIGSYILNYCYGVEICDFYNENLTFRNTRTGLVKYEEIDVRLDYVEVVETQPLLPLTEDQIRSLLESIDDASLWLDLLPPDRFLLKGFAIGHLHDVTKIQIHSNMREEISMVGDQVDPEEKLAKITRYFGSSLNDPSIRIGLANLSFIDLVNVNSKSLSLTGELDIRKITSAEAKENKCLYSDAIYRNKTVALDDIARKQSHAPAEVRLIEQGIQSIILSPIVNDRGRVISVLEIGSTKKFGVTSVTRIRLGEMIKLMQIMLNTFISEVNKDVNILIREHFTSIHPSVEWKFREAATRFQINQVDSQDQPVMEEIRFDSVYPIYGQSDIIGSSTLRTNALAEDLIFNLKSLSRLIDAWLKHKQLFLLESYKVSIQEKLSRLQTNFEAQDESLILDFLQNDIHPLLKQLQSRHSELPEAPYVEYYSIIDPVVGTVYDRRRKFELSVSMLNKRISDFFQREDELMQSTLPHFFEKYKTDGVEYNIYIGQSLLENGVFSENDLKEFRIWQLQKMAEVTRLVRQVSPTLDVPVTTAQLIFVYNNDLNIKFRMEEKKFDVDGSYNVRYEILKKRIDKATIKGTEERLTVEGKIAIVYLQEKDRREYLEYIKFLQHRGFLESEVELVELNKLQGAEGLKAIRVSVK